jgi:hypothetical protein
MVWIQSAEIAERIEGSGTTVLDGETVERFSLKIASLKAKISRFEKFRSETKSLQALQASIAYFWGG